MNAVIKDTGKKPRRRRPNRADRLDKLIAWLEAEIVYAERFIADYKGAMDTNPNPYVTSEWKTRLKALNEVHAQANGVTKENV